MNGDRQPELTKIKSTIMQVLNEKGFREAKIILFGSRARGDFKKGSDWDFLIVLKEELAKKEKWDLAHYIGKALAEIYVPCDVLVRSEKEVEMRKNVIGSVIRSALKTGVLL
jgi:predicted nucleotidyltransferase